MVTPQAPDILDAEDLRTLEDDPQSLESRVDLPVLVPALPVGTFVRIARRLRDDDRLELLLPYATTYQLTGLLDLDGWVRDRIDIRRARRWLAAIAEHHAADKPRGALADLIYAMDPELWTAALAVGTVVIELSPDDYEGSHDQAVAQLQTMRTWETPDGFFLVGVPDDAVGRATLRTLSRIYEDDLAEGRKLCLAIASLIPSQAEEELLRFRNGRLADLGFVPWEEAMRLLRPLDRRTAAQHDDLDFDHLRHVEGLGGLERSVRWRGPDLLRRVMLRLDPEQHGLRSREFLLLINEVMAAQRFDPGDEVLQQRAIDQTQATISLGLELLGREAPGGDHVEHFLAERMRAIGLRLLFRVGFGALHKVGETAQLLHHGGRVSLKAPGSLLDRPFGPAIAALCRQLPSLPRTDGKGTRPIASLADVATATAWVAQAAALAKLTFDAEGYAIDPAWIDRVDAPDKLTLGDLVRTAIVHAHLPGSTGALAPLTPSDLDWAQRNLLTPKGLDDAVGRDLSARCAALGIGEHQQALAEVLLPRLQVELAALERDADGHVDLVRTGGLLTIQHLSMWLQMRHGDPDN